MNRTAKILSLVLALALLCGALAVVSFADNSDITVPKNATFEGAAEGAQAGNPAIDGFNFHQKGKTDGLNVVVGADGNKYVLLTQENKAPQGTPYIYATFSRASYKDGVITKAANNIKNFKYIVCEFDVMAPTGKFSPASFNPYFHYLDGGNKNNFWRGDTVTNVVLFGNDDNGSYLYSDVDKTAKMYINPYEFTEISIIFENASVADEAGKYAEIKITAHVYVNGELFFSKESDMPADKFTYSLGEVDVDFYQFWLNYGHTQDATLSLAVDNIKVATVKAGSELAVKDIVTYDKANQPLGCPIAQVGETIYDNIDVALAAVAEGETLKLLDDVAAPFEVNKLIFIDPNGFKADVRPGEGYAIEVAEDGIYKVISSAGRTVEVFWDTCLHDPECEDVEAMHPLAYFDELAIGEKFYAAYNPTYSGLIGDDGKYYLLVGWKNVNTDEIIDLDAAVTEDDVKDEFVFLEPVYDIAVKNFEYTAGGKLQAAFDGAMTFAEVIKAADAGSTVKFFSDIKWANTAYIDIGKKLTIDLNGYTLIACREDGISTSKTQSKTSLFRMTGGTDLTVTSSRFGGKIFTEGWNDKTAFGAAGMFNWPNDTAILRINGNIDGKPALSIYTGNIVQGYGNACEYHIDGGMFVCVAGDQQGLFDSRKAGREATIENAFFYVPGSAGVISYAGRNTATDNDSKVTVDNCVFVGNAVANVVQPVVITMTNCYVTGDVNAVKSGTYSKVSAGDTAGQPNVDGTVIIGAGNYFAGKLKGDIQYADGVKLYEVPSTLEVSYYTHAWKASADYTFDASSFVVEEVTETLNFTHMATDVAPDFVNVIWKDAQGNVIGESQAIAGAEAAVPTNLKISGTLIPGWLDYVPAEWNESLVVPEGVEEYVITAKEGGAVTPVAAVELYFNIRLTTHFEYRLYIPVMAEGIEVTAIKFNNSDRLTDGKGGPGKYVTNYGKYTVNGKEYSMVDGWPGFQNGASSTQFSMSFTYGDVTYTIEKAVNIIDYCNFILEFVPAEGQLDYSPAARKLAANTANYLYNGLIMLGKTAEADKVKPIVDKYGKLINALDKENLPKVDIADISKYVSGATLYIDSYSVYMKFDLTDDGKAAKIALSTGATSGSKDKYPELGYILTNQTSIASLNKVTITITPAVAEGEEAVKVEKTFTLAEYYALLAASNVDVKILNTVEAMYAYAVADDEYN